MKSIMFKTVIAIFVGSIPVNAQWPTTPDSAIYVGSGSYKQVVEDGQGGVYIATGVSHAYCTRINHEGEKVWDHILLDGDYHETMQNSVALASDSSLLVSYRDILFIGSIETGDAYIRVQKISPSGDKLWGEGVIVTPDNASGSYDNYPRHVASKIIADDSGGAYVVWTDMRNDPSGGLTELYVQRLNADGEYMWDSLGIYVGDRVEQMTYLALSSASQLLLTYRRLNLNFAYHNHAQLFDESGTLLLGDEGHDFNRYPLSRYILDSDDNLLYSSGYERVFKVDLDFECVWPENGIAISDTSDFIWSMITDQNGGVVLQFQKDDTSHTIFSQWIERDGSLKYGSEGLLFATSDVEYVTTTMSDSSSFIVTYQDWYNYRAQRIDDDGNLLWPGNTLMHSFNHYTSHWQESVSDTENGIICVFDYNHSVYAAQMGPNGNVGSITSIEAPRIVPVSSMLISAYPNPFNPSTNLLVESPRADWIKINIYSLKGDRVYSNISHINSGKNNLTIDFSPLELASGIYILKVSNSTDPRLFNSMKTTYLK